jgi:hypothetical protein
MSEWFRFLLPTAGTTPPEKQAARLVVAAALGVAVAAIYFLTQRKRRTETASLVATIVLLTILLAMVTLVIGENLARAFGLAGVLSIVRFRTVVDDTRDTAFVIYAVVVGMAVGSELEMLAWVSLPVVGVTAWLLSLWAHNPGSGRGDATLSVRLGLGVDPSALLTGVLTKHLQNVRQLALNTARQGAAIDVTYAVRLKPGASVVALLGELNKVEGVQGVEWKEAGG